MNMCNLVFFAKISDIYLVLALKLFATLAYPFVYLSFSLPVIIDRKNSLIVFCVTHTLLSYPDTAALARIWPDHSFYTPSTSSSMNSTPVTPVELDQDGLQSTREWKGPFKQPSPSFSSSPIATDESLTCLNTHTITSQLPLTLSSSSPLPLLKIGTYSGL